jgi:hypothetical protein
MSRLCDDIITEQVGDYLLPCSEYPLSARKGDWRDALVDAERFDVSAALQMFEGRGSPIGLDDFASLRLPFPVCWVEGNPGLEGRGGPRKIGALLIEAGPTSPGAAIQQIVAYLAWDLIGETPNIRVCSQPASVRYEADLGEGSLVSADIYLPHALQGGMEEPTAWALRLLLGSVCLMNHRNVESTLIVPNPKVQRKRVARSRPPIFSYRVLVVRVQGQLQRLADLVTSGNTRELPLHKVRGHIKRFTPARPAFGRVAGTFWCPPFLRGKRGNGTIEKDYRIEPPKPPEAA